MRTAFSFDFTAVRVHTGAEAEDVASALGRRGRTAALTADGASPAAEREALRASMLAAMDGPVPALSAQPPTIACQSQTPTGSARGPFIDDILSDPDRQEPIAVRQNALDFQNNLNSTTAATVRAIPRGARPSTVPVKSNREHSSAARRRAAGAAPAVTEPVLKLAEGGDGRPLATPLREMMEARLGFDFSKVRVHDGQRAAAATSSVGALAYTLGTDIAFAPGAFQPGTPGGLHLIAHELCHVVQQSLADVSRQTAVIGEADTWLEREADQVAQVATEGRTVAPPRGRVGGGTAQLQRFLSTQPAGGCGLCYGLPKNAGRAAHALIQQEFAILYPLGLVELPIYDPHDDDNGRLDLAIAVPGGFEIGEIKPANEQGYADGITQLAKYIGMIASTYPGRSIKPLTKLLPPLIFPTLSANCPVQMLFVNPPVGGVYGYWCAPSYAELLQKGCTCPAPRVTQKQENEKEENEKEEPSLKQTSSPETQTQRQTVALPANARSIGERVLEFVKSVVAGGLNVEQAVSQFLSDNPDILRNIEVIVAAIVTGAILSDILSGGVAAAKDPAVVSVLTVMLRVARLLTPVAP